jgi:transcriptional regulator of arginine metabolism
MHKTKRLLAIEKIIAADKISSHGMLLRRLKAKGIICTQATLSRDLRQLGAGRISDGRGGYYYSLPDNSLRNTGSPGKQQVLPVLTDIVEARGLLVIKTLPGSASSTAYFIDNASRYEIAGTIAGDDTILIIPRDGVSVAQVHTCLELLIPGLHLKIKNK